MPTLEARKSKLLAARRVVPLQADTNGDIPTRIEVLRAGTWPMDSNKGMLMISSGDLEQMATNFSQSVGIPSGLGQLPIDFSHEDWDEAAGWITALIAQGDVLYADVTWSDSGEAALKGGRFKCFSPSFYPRCLGEWCDPEDWNISASNVLVGGALTNIPFFKDLQPIMASRDSQEDTGRNVIYVSADAKGARMPTLEEVVAKDLSALTEEDKTLLAENKDKLTADQKVKFGFKTAEVVIADNKKDDIVTDDQKKDAQVLADIRDGKKVLVDASEYGSLKTDVAELKATLDASDDEKIKAAVNAHVAAGRIIPDQADKWVKRIKADRTMLEDLAAMPINPVLADEQGKNNNDTDISASTSMDGKIKAAMEADKNLSYGDAVKLVASQNPDAVKQRESELTNK